MSWPPIQYSQVIDEARKLTDSVPQHLLKLLPILWRDAYCDMTSRKTNIMVIAQGSFTFIYDDYDSLEARGIVPSDTTTESRLVAVIGTSAPHGCKRDDNRLRGWVGPTGRHFGAQWDKGHFIANAIGGLVDGLELNVFVQSRALNRGWNEEGRRFRKMEQYCADHPGVLCFNRPIYSDESAKPSAFEFGILLPNNELWVELFRNS